MLNAHTLSIVMPLQNQQSCVAARIENLLEELAELTHQIEVMVVDDGSVDATGEVLDDMRRAYPQVRVMRKAQPVGPKAAAQAALPHVTGDLIFVQESYHPIDMDGLRQLWDLRIDEELVMAQVRTYHNEIDQELLDNLTNFAREFERNFGQSTAESVQKMVAAKAPLNPESLTQRTADGHLQMLRRDAIAAAGSPANASHLEMQRRIKSAIL